MSASNYIVITPARNEELHISRLIESVANQSLRPLAHLIISDGSTDRTHEIVRSYMRELSYLGLVEKAHDDSACFGSKATAFNLGWQHTLQLDYQYIANLDADISFEKSYFSTLINIFDKNQNLGLAGGLIYEKSGDKYQPQLISSNSVAGPVQCFRRRCLESIGGYVPLTKGGIDTLAEIMARMKGWETQTVRTLCVHAHRPVRTGNATQIGVRFNKGQVQYGMGYHPLYQLASCLLRIVEKPFLIGSLATLTGYIWASMGAYPRQISQELIDYIQREQLQRLGLSSFL